MLASRTSREYERSVPPSLRQQVERTLDALARDKRGNARPLAYLGAHIEGFDKATDGVLRKTNAAIAGELGEFFGVFLPQFHNPYGFLKGNSQGFEMALVDFHVIERASLCFFVAPFGRDTSCEAGFARGIGAPAILYFPDEAAFLHHRDDWMVLNSFTHIVVPQEIAHLLSNVSALSPRTAILTTSPNRGISGIARDVYPSFQRAPLRG